MARPSNTDERRGQITAGLVRVMARKGYDGATVADVAKAARLSPGLVHYHFRSKQEILLAALDELGARHLSRLDARLSEHASDARAALDAFIDVHLGLGAAADPEALACWILLSGEALREAKVQRRYAAVLEALRDRLRAVLEVGVTERHFTCANVDAAASALLATIQGYFVLAATARSLIPKGSAAPTTKRMALALVGGEP
jgi:TetR/AcrR family transcriptional regulator, transcriptional repressor of bet genes